MDQKVLCEIGGPLQDFLQKLDGKEGPRWLERFKRMLNNCCDDEIREVFREQGFNDANFRQFLQAPDIFSQLLDVVNGHAKVVPIPHIIDCDADPHCPGDYWEVETHKKGGEIDWFIAKTKLRLCRADDSEYPEILASDLIKKFAHQKVLNANVLDFLLANPELIPDAWKGMQILFTGTIYRIDHAALNVRYLHWNGIGWYEDKIEFYTYLDKSFRVALLEDN